MLKPVVKSLIEGYSIIREDIDELTDEPLKETTSEHKIKITLGEHQLSKTTINLDINMGKSCCVNRPILFKEIPYESSPILMLKFPFVHNPKSVLSELELLIKQLINYGNSLKITEKDDKVKQCWLNSSRKEVFADENSVVCYFRLQPFFNELIELMNVFLKKKLGKNYDAKLNFKALLNFDFFDVLHLKPVNFMELLVKGFQASLQMKLPEVMKDFFKENPAKEEEAFCFLFLFLSSCNIKYQFKNIDEFMDMFPEKTEKIKEFLARFQSDSGLLDKLKEMLKADEVSFIGRKIINFLKKIGEEIEVAVSLADISVSCSVKSGSLEKALRLL